MGTRSETRWSKGGRLLAAIACALALIVPFATHGRTHAVIAASWTDAPVR